MNAGNRNAASLLGCALVVSGVLAGVAAGGNPHGTPPGQEQQQQQAAANAQPTTTNNSTGVKPSSTTQHHTYAPAGSNKTKQYGNGQTAGQIAMKNGASAGTQLYGPGNSQPHKAAVCPKNGKTHYVDVHALKSHRAGACAAAAATTNNSSSVAASQAVTGTPNTSAAAGIAGAQAPLVHPTGRGAVLGVSASLGKPVTRRARPAHAVLGTAQFTG
jgi:hypothetical protein